MITQLTHVMANILKIHKAIKSLPDTRIRKSKLIFHSSVIVFIYGMMLQIPSINSMLNDRTKRARLQKVSEGPLPSDTTMGAHLAMADPQDLAKALYGANKAAIEEGALEGGSVDGKLVVAYDGVEHFVSKPIMCKYCHFRPATGSEEPEMFHRSLIVSTVGRDLGFHLILGLEGLKPTDSSLKAEGETTAAIRLAEEMHGEYGRIADYATADALYLKSPFINTLLKQGTHVIARIKDERYGLFKEAKALFESGQGRMEDMDFAYKDPVSKKTWSVEVWMAGQYKFANCDTPLKVWRFDVEPPYGEKETMYIATTDLDATAEFVWKCAHFRWDLELSGIKQLKERYNFDHNYAHDAIRQVSILIALAFNIRALTFGFFKPKLRNGLLSMLEATNIMSDELLKMRKPLTRLWLKLGSG